MYGMDFSSYFSLAKDSKYGDVTATAMLSYVRGENDTTDDNLYNMMPINAKLAVRQNKDSWSNSLEFELVDGKTNISEVRNELETNGYGLFHLRSSYQWESARIDFGIENVLDKFYNHPLAGAYTGQGKTMSGTGIPWGVSVPGMGRSIYAGVNFSF